METQLEIEQTLVIIKPDGMQRSLTGDILALLSHPDNIIVGSKVVRTTKELASAHYHHLKEKPFFEHLISYFIGEWHVNRVLALVYEGKEIIKRIREKAGATNPEEALPNSIRGKYGRIHSKTGVFENVVHCSENRQEAEREIKLWFQPQEIVNVIFPVEKRTETIEVLYWKE
jgi:nucleoside-diphosphate kinase